MILKFSCLDLDPISCFFLLVFTCLIPPIHFIFLGHRLSHLEETVVRVAAPPFVSRFTRSQTSSSSILKRVQGLLALSCQ